MRMWAQPAACPARAMNLACGSHLNFPILDPLRATSLPVAPNDSFQTCWTFASHSCSGTAAFCGRLHSNTNSANVPRRKHCKQGEGQQGPCTFEHHVLTRHLPCITGVVVSGAALSSWYVDREVFDQLVTRLACSSQWELKPKPSVKVGVKWCVSCWQQFRHKALQKRSLCKEMSHGSSGLVEGMSCA